MYLLFKKFFFDNEKFDRVEMETEEKDILFFWKHGYGNYQMLNNGVDMICCFDSGVGVAKFANYFYELNCFEKERDNYDHLFQDNYVQSIFDLTWYARVGEELRSFGTTVDVEFHRKIVTLTDYQDTIGTKMFGFCVPLFMKLTEEELKIDEEKDEIDRVSGIEIGRMWVKLIIDYDISYYNGQFNEKSFFFRKFIDEPTLRRRQKLNELKGKFSLYELQKHEDYLENHFKETLKKRPDNIDEEKAIERLRMQTNIGNLYYGPFGKETVKYLIEIYHENDSQLLDWIFRKILFRTVPSYNPGPHPLRNTPKYFEELPYSQRHVFLDVLYYLCFNSDNPLQIAVNAIVECNIGMNNEPKYSEDWQRLRDEAVRLKNLFSDSYEHVLGSRIKSRKVGVLSRNITAKLIVVAGTLIFMSLKHEHIFEKLMMFCVFIFIYLVLETIYYYPWKAKKTKRDSSEYPDPSHEDLKRIMAKAAEDEFSQQYLKRLTERTELDRSFIKLKRDSEPEGVEVFLPKQ
jgi:hypothetical protein